MVRAKPVGIDLGTTNSAVAWVDESGRSVMVSNSEGDLLTPSIVLFGDREVVVGKEARSATTVTPGMVAEWVKRDMGQPTYSHAIHGRYLPPEVIQACILKKLKSDVLGALGPDTKVVITVPAYFDEPRRKATADAGEMAGLSVLDIVNEPTAAALAFGEMLGYLAPTGAPKEEMTILVYDLGGGTFDATVLKLSAGNIRTIATDGDVQLGGHDWDQRLVDYVAEEFRKSHDVDPRQDPAGLNRLFNAVIEAKLTLTARSQATVRFDYGGRSTAVQISRERFGELTADLLERTAYTTRQLLAEAKLQWSDITRVLLVGGSTRMPMVAQTLQRISGLVPDRTVNPDEAVARGAALYAGYLLDGQAAGEPQTSWRVTNVNAHSLGVEGIDQQTQRKTNAIVIPRNTSLPANATQRFVTKTDDQRSIVLQVLEGESSLPSECTVIGRTVIRELPGGLPRGWPIEVTFEYGANGRLSVRAEVSGTDRDVTLDLERAVGLSNDGISRWKQPVANSAGFDAFEAMVQDVLDSPSPPGAPEAPAPTDPWSADSQPAAAAPAPAQPAAVAGASPATEQPTGDVPRAVAQLGNQVSPRAAPNGVGRPASPRIPRWLVIVVGYVTSAVLGLGLGYLVLSVLRPESFPFPPW